MTDLDAVFAHIDRNADAFVARLMDYVRHPSISAQDIGIAEVAGMLLEMLGRLGMTAELLPTAGHPMVLGRGPEVPGAPTVLLYGHYDVQPPEPLAAWTSPPFEPTIRDGRIYARGVGDNKGQHLAQLLAIESHLAVAGRLPCNVIVLLEGEEEVGSPHLAETVRAHADRLRADLVVTADGTLHPSGQGTILYGVRGVAHFELHVRTAKRDTHSGNFGGVVPNALWALVHLLTSMRAPDGRLTVAGLTDPVVPPGPTERAAAEALPIDLPAYMAELGMTALDAPRDRGFWERLMFHPTLTINGISGGYAGPGSKTVLPAEASAKCDIRLVEAMTHAQALAAVRAHVASVAPSLGAEVEVTGDSGMLPSTTPMDSPFAPVLRAALTRARGAAPLEYPCMGGSLPDYVFTKILGIPAFVTPYGNADEANHAPDENLRVDCFLAGIRSGAALLAGLGAMPR
jgi:acetylornithine deacetylase/succinyl-diaminopimelate desuccinylase-like protein